MIRGLKEFFEDYSSEGMYGIESAEGRFGPELCWIFSYQMDGYLKYCEYKGLVFEPLNSLELLQEYADEHNIKTVEELEQRISYVCHVDETLDYDEMYRELLAEKKEEELELARKLSSLIADKKREMNEDEAYEESCQILRIGCKDGYKHKYGHYLLDLLKQQNR